MPGQSQAGVGWGGGGQPAADLEQSATVGRAPPSPDQLSWKSPELAAATRGPGRSGAGSPPPLSQVTYEEETTGCDSPRLLSGPEIRGESAAAPRFQSTDIPRELSPSLQEPAACSLKCFLPSFPPCLPSYQDSCIQSQALLPFFLPPPRREQACETPYHQHCFLQCSA